MYARRARACCLALAMVGACNPVHAAGHDAPHWGYTGDSGPAVWATLAPEYAECGTGTRQSPIDLPVAVGLDVPSEAPATLEVYHHEHSMDVVNNGHTVMVTYDDGDALTYAGKRYALVQYHLHAPSEHTVGGQHFPLELHLVHRAEDGELAVVGVLLEKGTHQGGFDPVLAHLPGAVDERAHVEHVAIDVDTLLPAKRNAYAYLGSLTTPPCTEGVHWLVLRTPVELDAAQIEAFAAVLHDNARPVQPLGERRVSTTGLDGAP
ncbi:MAG: carbonic anhydrase [Gammaproteobacteria bacterium]